MLKCRFTAGCFWTLFACFVWPQAVAAEPFALQSSRVGHLDALFVGNTLVDNTGLTDGVNCLLSEQTAQIDANRLPPRAELVQAVLYVSGSLLANGANYAAGGSMFNPPAGLHASNSADLATLTALAQSAATEHRPCDPAGRFGPDCAVDGAGRERQCL